MKVIITKVPQNSKLKRGDTVNASGAQIDALVESGHEYQTETEFEAIKARELAQEEAHNRMVQAQEAAVDNAIEVARKAGVFAPKEDTAAIRARAVKMESVEAGLGVQHIQSLVPVKAKQNENGDLGKRVTATTEGGRPSVQLVRASLQNVGRGYIEASTPMNNLIHTGDFKTAFALSRQRAAILASDVQPILASGGDVAFTDLVEGMSGISTQEMVKAVQSDPDSQLGTISTGLLLTQDLGFLVNKVGFLKYISTDFSDKPARFGEPIYTRYKGVPNVLTFVPGVGFTSDATTISNAGAGTVQSGLATQSSGTVTKSAPSTTDVTVTLNQLKSVDIEFGLDKLASTVRNYFAEQKPMQTYALAEQIAKHFMSMVYAATWTGPRPSFVKSLANWDLKSLIGLKAALGVSKVPDVGRYAILHTFYHDKLYEDPSMMAAKAILSLVNKDQTVFESTDVPAYVGIKPIETQLASAAGSTITDWTDDTSLGSITNVGFAGNASSAIFVSRVPQDFTGIATQLGIPATAAVEIITEPSSGISMMVFKYMDLGKMSIVVRALLMWGDAQGDPRQGIVIKPV